MLISHLYSAGDDGYCETAKLGSNPLVGDIIIIIGEVCVKLNSLSLNLLMLFILKLLEVYVS